MCGASITAPASSLVGGAQKDSQVLGRARCWWALGWHLARLPSPWRNREEEKENWRGSVVTLAEGEVLLQPDLLQDEPLVIST